MHHQQKVCDSWFHQHRAYCVPSLLTRLIHSVFREEAIFILKNKHGQLEADPCMLSLVLAVLSFVLLVPHLYIHNVLHARAKVNRLRRRQLQCISAANAVNSYRKCIMFFCSLFPVPCSLFPSSWSLSLTPLDPTSRIPPPPHTCFAKTRAAPRPGPPIAASPRTEKRTRRKFYRI